MGVRIVVRPVCRARVRAVGRAGVRAGVRAVGRTRAGASERVIFLSGWFSRRCFFTACTEGCG